MDLISNEKKKFKVVIVSASFKEIIKDFCDKFLKSA